MNSSAAALGAAFAALYAAHQIADHWVQTETQAATKGGVGWAARLACGRHVAVMTGLKAAVLWAAFAVTGLPIRPAWWVLALGVDSVTHYVADRRAPLRRLAEACGHARFWTLGAPRDGRDDNPTLGTGAYAMDQSWHIGFLFIAALIIAAGAR